MNTQVQPLPSDCPAHTSQSEFAKWCADSKIDLVIVGPEQPLCDGLVDVLVAAGLRAFGPRAAPAQLEGSKEFAHMFMEKYGIPTSKYQSFTNAEDACAHIDAVGSCCFCATHRLHCHCTAPPTRVACQLSPCLTQRRARAVDMLH